MEFKANSIGSTTFLGTGTEIYPYPLGIGIITALIHMRPGV
jgi:hypothetical protein